MMDRRRARRGQEGPMSGSANPFRLIDDGQEVSVVADVRDGHVFVTREALKTELGWELKPEGLCQGDVCVPLRDRGALAPDGEEAGVDLAAFASALGRPLALETDSGIAALGIAAGERAAQLASLEAPDFELPDLDGKLHRLSDHRGKKVLLIAYASW
jgi:hypothetical protein